MTFQREQIVAMAKKAGFNASVGKTDKTGKYVPWVNAISKDVPVEWIERFAAILTSSQTGYLLEFTSINGENDTVVVHRKSKALFMCEEELKWGETASVKCTDRFTGEVIFEKKVNFP